MFSMTASQAGSHRRSAVPERPLGSAMNRLIVTFVTRTGHGGNADPQIGAL